MTGHSSYDKNFFAEFISFRNSLYKNENSYVKESLSEFRLLLDESSDFNKDYEWKAVLFKEGSRVVARALLCKRKSSSAILNLGYFEVIENIDIFKTIYNSIENLVTDFKSNEIKWPINANFFHSYRIKSDDLSSNLAPCYILKGYYRDFFQSVGYKKIRTWNNYKVSYGGYREKSLAAVDHIRSKYPYFDDIKVRPLNKADFKRDMQLFYKLLSASFEDKAEYESVSFRDFYSFYEDLKVILDAKLINFSSYSNKDLGFMICYSDYTLALRLKDQLDEKWYVPSIVAKLLALYKIKQKPTKVFLSFLGKDESTLGKEIKGLTIRHHEALIKYLDSISFEGDIYITLLEQGSNSDRQAARLAEPYNQYILYAKILS